MITAIPWIVNEPVKHCVMQDQDSLDQLTEANIEAMELPFEVNE